MLTFLLKLLDKMIFLPLEKFPGYETAFCGRDRNVIVFKNVVIKYPRMENWFYFIRGLYSNLKEIDNVKIYKGSFKENLPVIHSTWCLGMFIVMERYHEVEGTYLQRMRLYSRLELLLRMEDIEHRYLWEQDNKPENYGWGKYGQLVRFDLGTPY